MMHDYDITTTAEADARELEARMAELIGQKAKASAMPRHSPAPTLYLKRTPCLYTP